MELLLILIVTALNCHLVGHLLVIKNESMLADALSHAILLGIVLGFFVVQQLNSPLLVLFATLFGILTIAFINRLNHSQKINHDTATGLVFPFFFALAVILITMFANNVHLDMDMVLMGEIIFAPFTRVDVLGVSLSVAFIKSLINLVVLVIVLAIGYQPLKLYLNDPLQAKLAGINILLMQSVVMIAVAITTVLSFDVVGSISVISFLVAPSLCVLNHVKRYGKFLVFSSFMAVVIAIIGYHMAFYADLTVAGTTTTVALIAVIVTPFILKIVKKS